MEIGHELGLIGSEAVCDVRERRKRIAGEIRRVKQTLVRPGPAVNAYLAGCDSRPIQQGTPLDQIVKRAELGYDAVVQLAPATEPISPKVARQVEIEIKYEGYIDRQLREIEKFKDLERIRIPAEFEFSAVHGLSNEAKSKLDLVRPVSLGQAARIDGMTPAALSVLMVALKARSR
jgi:tRNA uridine 5-carboxymethylaminomethyl modification enzyme